MEGLSVRASDDDRDRVLQALRDRTAEGRLSHETFERRMETALRARTQAELSRLLEDLPPGGRLTRGLTGLVASLSALTARVGAAWRAPRLPRLTLPPQSLPRLLVGRAPICQIVMTDLSVSRLHAELRRAGDTWLLSDLGSMNGTRVNGYRIAGPTRVLPGDEVAFGDIRFIVCGNAPR